MVTGKEETKKVDLPIFIPSYHALPLHNHRPHCPALHDLHSVVGFALVHRRLRNAPVAHSRIFVPALHPPLVQRRDQLVWRTVGLGADPYDDHCCAGGSEFLQAGSEAMMLRTMCGVAIRVRAFFILS